MLKILLITDDDPVDFWVARQLAQQWPMAHCIVPSDDLEPDGDRSRLLAKRLASPLRVLSAIPRELIRKQVEAQREQTMATQLWGGEKPQPQAVLPNVIEIPVDQFNSVATAERIQALAPDLMLVCGGPVLTDSIFSIPRLGTLNLQWGISDRYRGQHGVFYPLAMGDFDAIGATLHQIDAGINQGEVLLQLFPALADDDTEASLEIKIARAIVPILIDFLKTLDASEPSALRGRTIDSAMGQEVRYRDRTACLETQYYFQRKLGRLRISTRPQRCDRFFKFDAAACV